MATAADIEQPQGHRPLPQPVKTGKWADGKQEPQNDKQNAGRGDHGQEETQKENTKPHRESSAELDDAAGLSFSQRAAQLARTPTPLLVKGDRHLLRDIDRGPPGDPPILRPRRKSLLLSSGGSGGDGGVGSSTEGAGGSSKHRRGRGGGGGDVANGADGGEGYDLARKRSQYFEDAFSARDADTSPAKERVRSEALVLAEVRTNVIVGDEFTVITELSAHLAVRYRRPLSSVVVTLQHNSCMCFGGSFDPAYVMAIFALPSQLQPATNKRNAALIQKHMEETLGVPPARGHLRFVAVPEANLAYGGKTTVSHVDEAARRGGVHGVSGSAAAGPNGRSSSCRSPVGAAAADVQSLGSSLGSRKYKTGRKLSVKSLSHFRSPSPAELTPPPSAVEEQPPVPSSPLPAIPERSAKEGPQERDRAGKVGVQDVPSETTAPMMMMMTRPSTAMSMGRHPSRRARRTKSFVATLFGRSGSKQEGHSA